MTLSSGCYFILHKPIRHIFIFIFFKDSHNEVSFHTELRKQEVFTRVCFWDRDSLICFDDFGSCACFCPELLFVVTLEASRPGSERPDTQRSARGFLDVPA